MEQKALLWSYPSQILCTANIEKANPVCKRQFFFIVNTTDDVAWQFATSAWRKQETK